MARMPVAAFVADEQARTIAERNLQLAAQICIDVASHIVAQQGWGDPTSYRDALAAVCTRMKLEPSFTARFEKIAGLRNLLVHDYLEIDPAKLHASLKHLADFGRFARAVAKAFPP